MAPLPTVNNLSSDVTVEPQNSQPVKSYEFQSNNENIREKPDLSWSDLIPQSPDQSENDTYPMHIQTAFRIEGK
ncbi:unnamed protein product [Trichobilharzia regenti]|nr:unnamed protein product [Trichobilharzia regenti]